MKKICVFTGTRADYGLLFGLLKEISSDSELSLDLMVSGTHPSKIYGETIKFIERDGFKPLTVVDIGLVDNSILGICKSQGLAIGLYAEALSKLKPEIAVVLGDRYEALSFAVACNHLGIPLCHIHGGEITLGATDDSFRHAITKLSYLHFTTAEEYRQRVVQLGEAPARVFNVGSLGVENIKKLKLLSKAELQNLISWGEENILVTFHPETNTNLSSSEQIEGLFSFLDSTSTKTTIIFTMPNADANSMDIWNRINDFKKNNSARVVAFESMGLINYLSAMKHVDMVVGNSSSGIIETPSFGIPTINIGDRQKGRLRARSVIDCDVSESSIKQAYETAKKLAPELKKSQFVSPFDGGETAKKVKEIIKSAKIPPHPVKEFLDLNV